MKNQTHPFVGREVVFIGVLALLVCQFVVGRAQATILYTTSNGGYSEIDQVDTIPQTASTYLSITPSDQPDSIIFDSSGNVIYSAFNVGEVIRYDPNTTVSTVLATGLGTPADMVLEPGGNSMLVSGYSGGTIDRINLNTNTVTPLSAGLGNPEGLAYVGSKLFANIGYRYGGATAKEVAQIDPVTGAILATSPGLNSLDGLTYDPYSGLLYAASLLGNLIYSIDPNNLNNVQIATGTRFVPGPDGITADGLGNIFIASSASDGDSHVYQFNLISNTLTQNAFVPGLDDLAPASGDGSVPEPSSLALLSFGVLGFGARRRRSVTMSVNATEPSGVPSLADVGTVQSASSCKS
jgi:streptogramin lyase